MSTQRCVQYPWLTDDITTSNATPTVSAATSFVIPSGVSGYVEVLAIAKDASQNTAPIKIGRSFKNVAGTLSLGSAAATIVGVANGDIALASILLTIQTSGTTVQPTVTGIAATTIEWLLDVRYWQH
jgi:hypothetical protein